ncbi:MAG: hypothetical protein H0X37_01280 [Herpetosiphonaceae bacterium]|nr:hypothetical protein [Herpetosiphonaceae bacterium]
MATMTYTTDAQPTIRIEATGGDLRVEGSTDNQIEVRGKFRDDAVRQNGQEWTIGMVSSDLDLRVPHGSRIVVYRVGGDAEVSDVALLEAATIGGDLEVEDVAQVRVDAIGGDGEFMLKGDQATIGRVGGDLEVRGAAQLTVGVVGGDAELEDIGTLRGLEKVGGDLELAWQGAVEGELRIKVGGDARLRVGSEANFILTGVAQGDIQGHGQGWDIQGHSSTLNATFGAGTATLYLRAGGELEVEGGPVTNSSLSGSREGDRRPGWGFGGEMRSFGREMEAMARDLARELGNVGRDVQREVMREVMNDEPREPGRPGRPRVHVRVNNREFNFDPEQVERIKREAQSAAANGIARAQEAVMRAFNNMNIPTPPAPPSPPAQPSQNIRIENADAPAPPPPAPGGGYTGQTVRIDHADHAPAPAASTPPSTPVAATPPPPPPAAPAGATLTPGYASSTVTPPANPDEERLAILRMVAAGQITPDEAEGLLRGLERTA